MSIALEDACNYATQAKKKKEKKVRLHTVLPGSQ